MLICKSVFVHLGKIVNELLFICEVNEQKHEISFPKTDLVMISTETRFDFGLTEFGI